MARLNYFLLSLILFFVFSISELKAQDVDNSKLEFVIKGIITDAATNEPIENVTVTLTGSDNTVEKITTSKNGKYEFDKKGKKERYLKYGVTYRVVVTKDGYLKMEGEESTQDVDEGAVYELDFALESAK